MSILASLDLSSASTILSGLAIFFTVLIVPLAMIFHKRVVRPLSFVLGLKAEDSPTGTAVPTIPQQLAAIRSELHPNGGSSMRDSIDRNERAVHEVQLRVVDLEGAVRLRMAETDAAQNGIRRTLDVLLAGQLGAAERAKQTAIDMADTLRAEGTTNGITAALLLERAEGRRILLDKPDPKTRTTSEQHYVDLLIEGGRNSGATAATDRTIEAGESVPMTQAERDKLQQQQ